MTITAQGPDISVVLNGSPVSTIHLDDWTVPGKRPDGSNLNKFKNVAVANLARIGYVGFQGVNGDCWFNHIRLRKLSPGGISRPGRIAENKRRPPASFPMPAAEPYVETARFIGHAHSSVECVRALPDGKRLLSTSSDKTARLWEIATGRELRRFWHPQGVFTAALLPDGRRAITGCGDGVVRLWDLESGTLIRNLVQHSGLVHSVAVSADGTHALSAGDDKTVRILDVARGGEVKQFEGASAPVMSVAISKDGRRVLAGCQNGLVYVGNTMTSDPLKSMTGHSNWIFGVAFAPDNGHAVSADADGRLIFWDLERRQAQHQVKLDSRVRSMTPEPGGRRVIFGTEQLDSPWVGSIGDWDVTTDGPARQLASEGGYAHLGLALLPHDAIASADRDGLVHIWEPSASIAKARQLAKTGKRAVALPEYDRAVANRPSDPRLLIERGRLLATLGQADKAVADFENAASLAPESPQFFLDAPWWVAGPYPPDFNQAGPLESATATDPSQPAPPSGNTTVRWHEITPHQQGRVNFEELFKAEGIVVGYAMTVVYSARPREAVLLIGTDDTARIWLNGREVFLSKSSSDPDSSAILATLQSGRNTFVVKVKDLVKGGHSFSFRFGEDSPADLARAYAHAGKWREAAEYHAKAMALDPDICDRESLERWAESMAQAERWKEAKEAFDKIAALDPGNFDKQSALGKCFLALGDQPAFERLCTKAIAQHKKTQDRKLANRVIWLVALMPNAVHSYAEAVEIGNRLVKGRNPEPYHIGTFGGVLYRAGLYPSSLSYLKVSIDAQKGEGNPWDWVFTAMARHKSRQPGDREALSRAKAMFEKSPPTWWQHRIELKVLFNEAEELLKTPPPR